jgi:hypothetical protein
MRKPLRMRKEPSVRKKKTFLLFAVAGICCVLVLGLSSFYWRQGALACPLVGQEAEPLLSVHVDVDGTTQRDYYPDRSAGDLGAEEHALQSVQSLPLRINFFDASLLAVPAYARNFSLFGSEGNKKCLPFDRLVVHVESIGQGATIRFSYPGSNPAGVTRSYDSNEDSYVYQPATGKMRIWKKDGPALRNMADVALGGDYVTPDVDYPLGLFCFDRCCNLTLYLEAVDTTSDGETGHVIVTLNPGIGKGPSQDSFDVEYFFAHINNLSPDSDL